MKRILIFRIVLEMVSVLILIFPHAAQSQLVTSAFAEASVAYVALSGLGINFASANPAMLSDLSAGKRFAYILEATDGNIRVTFKDELPDFALQLAITPRLTIALAQSERAPSSSAHAIRAPGDDPFFRHPLRFLTFSYQQDWSAGIGFHLKSSLSVGMSIRHENYVVFPLNLGFSTTQSFRTFDLGLKKSGKPLNLGLVFHNLIRNRTTEPFSQLITIVMGPDSVIAWHPTQFEGIAFEPKFAVEGGIHWLVSSHWQLLGDVSSRKEYALGLRWRVFSKFFITTGTGKRFDRIYANEAATYTSLGGQFQHTKFALGLTWIIPTRSGRNRIVSMPYGNFDLRQITNHCLLIAAALSL